MKIQIKDIEYPVESYQGKLIQLIDEVSERKDIAYQVPYGELASIYDELDPEPDIDIAIFNEKYARVQAHHNRLCKVLTETLQEYKVWQTFLSRAKNLYKKAKNNIFTTDDTIRALRNKDLQEAALQEKIPDLVDLIDNLEIIVDELKEEVGIVKLKCDLLDKANTNMNRQQKVVEDEIGLGYKVGVRVNVRT